MRQDLYGGRAEGQRQISQILVPVRRVMTGDWNVPAFGPNNIFLDPNGQTRTVRLPVQDDGMFFILNNVGSFEINIRDADGGTLLAVLPPRAFIWATSSGVEWILWPQIGKASGASHAPGLAPDPGAVAGAVRFLREDFSWASVHVVGVVDSFKNITDGTNTAVASGPDTFKFRSSGGTISPVVTNNHATHGDSINLDVVPGAINHNALLNYVADQHVAHSSVSMSAGEGLTGGGTIAANRSFALNFNGLTLGAPGLNDKLAHWDVSASAHRNMLISDLNAILVHDNLTGYSANRHIDHTGVSIVAGTGLSGGGSIDASRTLNVAFNEFETGEAIAAADLVPFYDTSESDHNTTPFSTFNAALDHNVLVNRIADEHVAHSGVVISSGAGLTGGASIAASFTLNVGEGAGIKVNANDVALADITGPTVYGRTSGTGVPQQLTSAELTTLVNTFTTALKGLVPPPSSVTNKFLRDDGTWQTPAGAGDVVGPASAVDNAAARFDTTTGKLLQNSALLIADTTGDLSRSGGGGIDLEGTNSNDDAAAGQKGEYVSQSIASGSAVALTTATDTNVASISLTAGDWDVRASCGFAIVGTTDFTRLQAGISQNTAAFQAHSDTRPRATFMKAAGVVAAGNIYLPMAAGRISINSTTTFYLVAEGAFTAGTVGAFGFIAARRVR